jgi:hypothetical protein
MNPVRKELCERAEIGCGFIIGITGRRRCLLEVGRAVDTAMQRSSARIHSTSLRAGCNTPYQMERLRSDVAITVSSKKPVTVGSAETTAPGEKPMHL